MVISSSCLQCLREELNLTNTMKVKSSKPVLPLAGGLITSALLFVMIFAQGCDSFAFRDALKNKLGGDDLRTQLVVYENGAVLASGPVQQVSSHSFDLAGVTFAVTARTSMMDPSGAALSLSDIEVGVGLEVDGTQHEDGSFEASFAEVILSLSSTSGGDDHGEDHDEDDGDEEKVTICHIPPGNPDNARTKNVGEGAAAAHLAHGDTEGECPSSQPVEGEEGEDGEDDDGDDNDGDSGVKKVICHVPPGNPDNERTISIDSLSVQDHLDHGDTEGECGASIQPVEGDEDGDDDEDGEKVTICHISPGNPDDEKTKNIDLEDLDDHLEHGDKLGACGEIEVPPVDSGG